MPNQTNHQRPTTAPGRLQHKRRHAPHGARHRRGQCPVEHCSRCGLTLRPAEPAFLWKTEVVCGECYTRRQAALVAAALVAPHLPAPGEDLYDRRPWWQQVWRGARGLLRLPLTVGRLLSRKNRRRRQAAAVAPLFAHLHRRAYRV